MFCTFSRNMVSLLISGDPPPLASPSAGITALSHYAWPTSGFSSSLPSTKLALSLACVPAPPAILILPDYLFLVSVTSLPRQNFVARLFTVYSLLPCISTLPVSGWSPGPDNPVLTVLTSKSPSLQEKKSLPLMLWDHSHYQKASLPLPGLLLSWLRKNHSLPCQQCPLTLTVECYLQALLQP